jgi:hypothetical protein
LLSRFIRAGKIQKNRQNYPIGSNKSFDFMKISAPVDPAAQAVAVTQSRAELVPQLSPALQPPPMDMRSQTLMILVMAKRRPRTTR